MAHEDRGIRNWPERRFGGVTHVLRTYLTGRYGLAQAMVDSTG